MDPTTGRPISPEDARAPANSDGEEALEALEVTEGSDQAQDGDVTMVDTGAACATEPPWTFFVRGDETWPRSLVFSRRKEPIILNITPAKHVDVETEPEAAFAALLLHTVWPDHDGLIGEAGLGAFGRAIETFRGVVERGDPKELPPFFHRHHGFLLRHRENLRTTEPRAPRVSDAVADEDDADGRGETDDADADGNIREGSAGDMDDEGDFTRALEPVQPVCDAAGVAGRVDVGLIRKLKKYIRRWRRDAQRRFVTEEGVDESRDPELYSQLLQGGRVPVRHFHRLLSEFNDLFDNETNEEQRAAYRDAELYIAGLMETQLVMFLTGGGGTGKSQVIRLLKMAAVLAHGRTTGKFGPVVTVAPTGNAAHNVGGYTWHSAFGKTPRDVLEVHEGIARGSTAQHRLKKDLAGVKLVIIDEISMIGVRGLLEIHKRLCAARDVDWRDLSTKPFGGFDVVLAGDFYQLPPVKDPPALYARPEHYGDGTVERYGLDLFQKSLTHYHELKTNHRMSAVGAEGNTKKLLEFVTKARRGVYDATTSMVLYLNLAVGGTFENRLMWALERADPRAVCLAGTNAMCDRNNEICFHRLRHAGKAHFRIFARHDPAAATSAVGKPEGEEKLKLLQYDPRRPSESRKKARADNRYAAPVLDLAVGSRVAVSENIAVNLGLYRGALGTIVGFVFEEDAPTYEDGMPDVEDVAEEGVDDREIPIVLVRMEDHYTGPSCIVGEPNVVPFYATPSRDRVLGKYHRVQLPLEPAHARTIHKAQGLTASHGVIVVPGTNAPTQLGLYYVAISRAKWADALFVTAPFARKHFENNKRQYERIDRFYEKLRERFRNQEVARVRDSADFARRQQEYQEDRRQCYECDRLGSEAAEVAREADAFLAAQAAAAAAAVAAAARNAALDGAEVEASVAAAQSPALCLFGQTRNLVGALGDDDYVSSKDSLMSGVVDEGKRKGRRNLCSAFGKSDASKLSQLGSVEARLECLRQRD
ncbi:MAG: AAA family ATPase [Myxococcota bacterium]